MNDHPFALRVRDLTVSYGSGRHRFDAVRGADLDLPAAGTLGLVGESGSGKSTIGRALAGLLAPSGGSIETADGGPARIGMVFQNPRASFNPRMRVREALLEAWETVPVAARRTERDDVGAQVLSSVGLGPEALDRYPHEFSGGQLQRIAIARTLAAQPQIVVLDEVTSALDVGVQATILRLLQQVQRDFGLTYLFISHDLAVVAQMADEIAVLYVGRVLERGPVAKVFKHPRHPYTRVLLDSAPRLGVPIAADAIIDSAEIPDPREPPPGCPYWTRCPIGPIAHPDREVCRTDPPLLTANRTGRTSWAACHFPLDLHTAPPSEGEHIR